MLGQITSMIGMILTIVIIIRSRNAQAKYDVELKRL